MSEISVYLAFAVQKPNDLCQAMTRYEQRFGRRPERGLVSTRCTYKSSLPLLSDVAVEERQSILPGDLYLAIPGGGEL